MAVNGIQKFSLLDYPGKLSCIVFFGNCNFRCPFCHNPALIFDPESQGSLPPEELATFFRSRAGKLDGVVFSGGEPTLQTDLEKYLRLAKENGFSVKLDTNGSRPEVVRDLFGKGLIDDFGIDWKAPSSRYAEVCGNPDPSLPGKVLETIAFAVQSKAGLDVRTTVHRALLCEEDLRKAAEELQETGVPHWVLQQFHKAELIDESLLEKETWSDSELKQIAVSLNKPGFQVSVRGTLR